METEEAARISKWPGLYPRRKRPARIEFDGLRHFNISHAATLRVHGEQCRSRSSIPLRPALAGTTSHHSTRWQSSRCYNTAFHLFGRRFNRAGFNVATLVPHTNLSAVRGEPLTRIVWSSRRLCRRTSPRFARSLAGSLMKVAHPWGFRVFRLGDGLRD